MADITLHWIKNWYATIVNKEVKKRLETSKFNVYCCRLDPGTYPIDTIVGYVTDSKGFAAYVFWKEGQEPFDLSIYEPKPL